MATRRSSRGSSSGGGGASNGGEGAWSSSRNGGSASTAGDDDDAAAQAAKGALRDEGEDSQDPQASPNDGAPGDEESDGESTQDTSIVPKPKNKRKFARIDAGMQPGSVADSLVRVFGPPIISALWGTLTARMNPEVMKTLVGTENPGRGSKGSSSTPRKKAVDNELSRHRRSRAHTTWMLAPVAATMTGALKNKYNLGTNKKRTEVDNNAFLMSAFLLTKELPGQSNEAFRGEFIEALNATRSTWHKIIREAIKVYCTGLYARVVDFHRDDGPDAHSDCRPEDGDDVILQSIKLASQMEENAPATVLLRDSILDKVLGGHRADLPRQNVTLGDVLGPKGTTSIDKLLVERLFRPLISSALSSILSTQAPDRDDVPDDEHDLAKAQADAMERTARWSVLVQGGGSKNQSFTDEMWGTFLKMWTGRNRPMNKLITMNENDIQSADLVAFCRPYLKRLGSCGASATTPSAPAAQAHNSSGSSAGDDSRSVPETADATGASTP